MNDQVLEVTSFKYLRATVCKDSTCPAEIRIRTASAMAAMARSNRIWRSNTISCASKFNLYLSSPSSSLWLWDMDPACLLWEKGQSFLDQVLAETSPRLLLEAQDQWLGVEQENFLAGLQERLLATAWFGHVTRHDILSKPSFRAPWRVGYAVLAGEMLDGQRQRVDVSVHATQNCLQWPPQKRLEEDLCWIVPHIPPPTPQPPTPDDPIDQENEPNLCVLCSLTSEVFPITFPSSSWHHHHLIIVWMNGTES